MKYMTLLVRVSVLECHDSPRSESVVGFHEHTTCSPHTVCNAFCGP